MWSGNVLSGRTWIDKCLKLNPNNISALADIAYLYELTQEYTMSLALMAKVSILFDQKIVPSPRSVLGLHLISKKRLRRRMIFVAQLAGETSMALALQKEYVRSAGLSLPYRFREWDGEPMDGKKVVAITELGIGDEIRYTSVFDKYFNNTKSLLITCDPRLFTIFTRSFPNFNFEPVQRDFSGFKIKRGDKRELAQSNKMYKICSDKIIEMGRDADIWLRTINLFEQDAITTNANYQSSERPVLVVDAMLAKKFKKKLRDASSNKKTIGLSWRGGRQTYSRTPHYFKLEEWESILNNENYCFVNLQYSIIEDELNYLRERLGDRFIEFSDLDLYNDFEGMAALCSELDMVISVCTAILELAGAVNAHSLYLMPNPQATHAIRLGGYRDNNYCYQDTVWKNCKILPKFDLSEKEMIDCALLYLDNFFKQSAR